MIEITNELKKRSDEFSDPKFIQFLHDIDRYFYVVVVKKLGWQPKNIKFNHGLGNVVLRFETDEGRFIFRVPKKGIRQLRAYQLAQSRFADHDFLPPRVYIDHKCVIEKYVTGDDLGSDEYAQDFVQLAQALSVVHEQTSKKYGTIVHGNVGMYESFEQCMKPRIVDRLQLIEDLETPLKNLDNERYETVKEKLLSMIPAIETVPTVLCHGDVWQSNVLYDPLAGLTLLDWDNLSSFPKEMDLFFLSDPSFTDTQCQAFVDAYAHDINWSLVAWFALERSLYRTLNEKVLVHPIRYFWQRCCQ